MAKYMLLLGGADKNAPDREQAMRKYQEWTERLVREGRLQGAHKLRDGQGRTLRFDGERVMDGPFSETKETIGGYYLIEAADYAEAARIAADCPVLRYQRGFVEIREVER